MTEVNVNDLNDAGLDWAVAICEKVSITGRGSDGRLHISTSTPLAGSQSFAPSSDHWTGDAIVSRENILITEDQDQVGYRAFKISDGAYLEGTAICFGKTPLVAAMRCYVANTLGSAILVPDEIAKPLMSPQSGPWGV